MPPSPAPGCHFTGGQAPIREPNHHLSTPGDGTGVLGRAPGLWRPHILCSRCRRTSIPTPKPTPISTPSKSRCLATRLTLSPAAYDQCNIVESRLPLSSALGKAPSCQQELSWGSPDSSLTDGLTGESTPGVQPADDAVPAAPAGAHRRRGSLCGSEAAPRQAGPLTVGPAGVVSAGPSQR